MLFSLCFGPPFAYESMAAALRKLPPTAVTFPSGNTTRMQARKHIGKNTISWLTICKAKKKGFGTLFPSLAFSPSGVVEVSVSALVVRSECALAPGAFFCLRENSLQPVTQHSHHQLDHYHSRSSSLPPVQPTLRCLPPPPLPLVLPPPTPDVDGYYIQLHTHTHS